MRLGVITNELFEPGLGRTGGFGWAAREVVRAFRDRPDSGRESVEVVLICCEAGVGLGADRLEGARLLHHDANRLRAVAAIGRLGIDALLAIDYRPSYQRVMAALPRKPLIIWVRDPVDRADDGRRASLRVPGDAGRPAGGVRSADTASLARWVVLARAARRPLLLASPAPDYLRTRAAGAYGLRSVPDLRNLPNPIPLPVRAPRESERPRVVFVGRLDPIKRPWLVAEIARRMPGVEFIMLGREQAPGGSGPWRTKLPPNVRIADHVDGREKTELLGSAWAMVNTSMHEGLPVSFLEALACATPIVAALDPERVVSRFGLLVAQVDGDGLPSVPAYAAALKRLLGDHETRWGLGAAGREWVRARHSHEAFLAAFDGLVSEMAPRSSARPGGGRSIAAARDPARVAARLTGDPRGVREEL